jgi:hypothetical protein
MEFCSKARPKPTDGIDNFDESWEKFYETVVSQDGNYNEAETLTGIPIKNLRAYDRSGSQGVYPDGTQIYLNHDQIYKVYQGYNGVPKCGSDNYRKAIVQHLKDKYGLKDFLPGIESESNLNKYVFIIDEINRGEISKIFGELFFSIDPGYRGLDGAVYTQYQNMHDNPDEKFYVPENVYIIGTMNDIDRSVESFDFAMRRRFRFIEVKPEDTADSILSQIDDEDMCNEAMQRMTSLNNTICGDEFKDILGKDYQIGASYFLKLNELDGDMDSRFDFLWEDWLRPLLEEYLRGSSNYTEKLDKLEEAYGIDAHTEAQELDSSTNG